MRGKVWLMAVLLAGCAVAASASMVKLSTENLVNNATLVITGTVEDVTSYPPDSRGVIYSEARVRVGDVVVGATDEDVVTVRYMGGQYGDLAMVVEVVPQFSPGEEVVLFLAPGESGTYIIPDGVQSKQLVVDGTCLPADVTLTSYLNDVTAAAGR
jgi:hypothetical protein